MTQESEKEPETSLYAALRNRDKELERLRELLQIAQQELAVARSDADINERLALHHRLTSDKYEPPRIARELGRYIWSPNGMRREAVGDPGFWTWCSVADVLAFEDERAGMIARIDCLEAQAKKVRADKIVIPRYKNIPFADDAKYSKSHASGYNAAIADWFELNPSVETTIATEKKE